MNEAGKELRRRSQRLFYAWAGGLGLIFALLMAVEFIQVRMVA